MAPDVPSPDCAQKGVRDRVEHGVGIGMARQTPGVRDFDPTQDQPSTGDQRMDVITISYTKSGHRSRS